MDLRDYQQEAVDACLQAIKNKVHGVCQLPTGSGKTFVISGILEGYLKRVLVLSHVREILEQNERIFLRIGNPFDVGVFSAGMGRKDSSRYITIAGVQSIFKRMDLFSDVELILIDEAHRVPNNDEEIKMYRAVFDALPSATRIGLTATPYRGIGVPIYGNDNTFFNQLIFSKTIPSLTPEYLSPLCQVYTRALMVTEGARTTGGDFAMKDIAQLNTEPPILENIFSEMLSFLDAESRTSVLVFCATVEHGGLCAQMIAERGKSVREVYGHTPKQERNSTLQDFKCGEFEFLISVGVLTTGFDAPNIDAIVLLRPTKSQSLYVQMVGRGSRKSEGKEDCLILDFAGNKKRFPNLDEVFTSERKTPQKEALDLEEESNATRSTYKKQLIEVFDFSDDKTRKYKVQSISYEIRDARDPGKKHLVLKYFLEARQYPVLRWLCVEVLSGARYYAEQWFSQKGVNKLDVPRDALDALILARTLSTPESVLVDESGSYGKIVLEFDAEDKETEESDNDSLF